VEKSQEIPRERSFQVLQFLVFAKFNQNLNARGSIFRKQRYLADPLDGLHFLSKGQSFIPKLKFMLLYFLEKSRCSFTGSNSERKRGSIEITGQS